MAKFRSPPKPSAPRARSAAPKKFCSETPLRPGNAYALLMQGRNLLEAGDSDGAIECLQKVSDLDSIPDGLRDLLKAD